MIRLHSADQLDEYVACINDFDWSELIDIKRTRVFIGQSEINNCIRKLIEHCALFIL